MKKIWMLPTAFFLSCALMGCSTSQDDEETNNDTAGEATVENKEGTEGNDTNRTEDNIGDQAQLEMDDEAADNIAELEEVDRATVITTDNNAYVGVVLQGETEGLEKVEEKIAKQVKSTNTNIENVYVSVNPDFVDQMEDYGNKINAGEPIEGLFEEFSDIVQRVFPDAH